MPPHHSSPKRRHPEEGGYASLYRTAKKPAGPKAMQSAETGARQHEESQQQVCKEDAASPAQLKASTAKSALADSVDSLSTAEVHQTGFLTLAGAEPDCHPLGKDTQQPFAGSAMDLVAIPVTIAAQCGVDSVHASCESGCTTAQPAVDEQAEQPASRHSPSNPLEQQIGLCLTSRHLLAGELCAGAASASQVLNAEPSLTASSPLQISTQQSLQEDPESEAVPVKVPKQGQGLLVCLFACFNGSPASVADGVLRVDLSPKRGGSTMVKGTGRLQHADSAGEQGQWRIGTQLVSQVGDPEFALALPSGFLLLLMRSASAVLECLRRVPPRRASSQQRPGRSGCVAACRARSPLRSLLQSGHSVRRRLPRLGGPQPLRTPTEPQTRAPRRQHQGMMLGGCHSERPACWSSNSNLLITRQVQPLCYLSHITIKQQTLEEKI
jgi:hypothetical protein